MPNHPGSCYSERARKGPVPERPETQGDGMAADAFDGSADGRPTTLTPELSAQRFRSDAACWRGVTARRSG
jgi:hypothetical protein